jgi:hypothetical protein
MNSQEKVVHCYNQVADDYAAERWDELSKKNIDRLLLKEFATLNKDKGPCADLAVGPDKRRDFFMTMA